MADSLTVQLAQPSISLAIGPAINVTLDNNSLALSGHPALSLSLAPTISLSIGVSLNLVLGNNPLALNMAGTAPSILDQHATYLGTVATPAGLPDPGGQNLGDTYYSISDNNFYRVQNVAGVQAWLAASGFASWWLPAGTQQGSAADVPPNSLTFDPTTGNVYAVFQQIGGAPFWGILFTIPSPVLDYQPLHFFNGEGAFSVPPPYICQCYGVLPVNSGQAQTVFVPASGSNPFNFLVVGMTVTLTNGQNQTAAVYWGGPITSITVPVPPSTEGSFTFTYAFGNASPANSYVTPYVFI